MRTIIAKIIVSNYTGIHAEEEIEVEDNATDEEIDSMVWNWALEDMQIETDWEEVK